RRFQEIAAFGVILIFVAPVEAHAAIAALGDALALVERQRQLQAEIAQESIGKRPRRRGLDHYRDVSRPLDGGGYFKLYLVAAGPIEVAGRLDFDVVPLLLGGALAEIVGRAHDFSAVAAGEIRETVE